MHLSNRVREHYAWFKGEGSIEKGIEVNQQASDLKVFKNGGSEVEKTEESTLEGRMLGVWFTVIKMVNGLDV